VHLPWLSYDDGVTTRIPVGEDASRSWTEVAHGSRMSNHMLQAMPDPAPISKFAMINAEYPFEKASDWHRSYLSAALEHLVVWADIAAPLKFHPEQEVLFSFRPAHTLGRAAMEAASQAIWVSSGDTARECARRHLSLIRWDYVEHRKSESDPQFKARVAHSDLRLLERASQTFDKTDLQPPSHLSVLRASAPVVGLDPDRVETVWRAASGAAHGKAWASLALQEVVPLDEYESGQFRTIRVPDADAMTEVLKVAEHMTTYGVLRHADFCGADITSLLESARVWLAGAVPYREDADPEVVARLKRRTDEIAGD
jgi:hypothetical protein